MSLSSKTVDRLWDRLAATYGREWLVKWEGIDTNATKSLWAHELSMFADRLEAVAWALEHLPERAPNVIQFRELCRQAPRAATVALPEPKADPSRVAAELSKLGPVLARAKVQSKGRNVAWAHRIIARVNRGESLSPTVVDMAERAIAAVPERA